MPANVPGRFPRRVAVCWAVGLLALGMIAVPRLQHRIARGWGQYHEPAPAGPREERVRRLILSDAPLEIRFSGLFEYFAAGFMRHAVPGYARVQYGGAGSHNGYRMDGLEGFARTAPLLAAWVQSGRARQIGVTPGAAAAGATGDIVEMLRSGILAGVDPASSEYWGGFQDDDQRIVEAADVARVLWLTRATLWARFSDPERNRVLVWLAAAANRPTPRTNWMLFPVVINLVIASLRDDGAARRLVQRAHEVFADYRRFYRDHGWFYDPPHGIDFYNTWGITYDLFWIHRIDPTFETDFIVTTIGQSADLTQHLISPAGIPIMGRSVCYRTAVPVPLIAATLLESNRFSAGRAARGLDLVWRYFVSHDSLRDGALTQGYFNADLRLLDVYSGSGSCQWGLRSLVLAFLHPAGDGFWTAPQQPLPVEVSDYRLELTKLGWIVEGRRSRGEIVITLPGNPSDVTAIDEYSWTMRVKETLLREPVRPGNHEIKYESRHYSSGTPYPLF